MEQYFVLYKSIQNNSDQIKFTWFYIFLFCAFYSQTFESALKTTAGLWSTCICGFLRLI